MFKFGTHIYVVSLLIPIDFRHAVHMLLRFQLESWYVYTQDSMIY